LTVPTTVGRPKRRRLGQNFLVDRGVARRIADLLDDDPPRVVEIGPGRGALTDVLLDRFRTVRAVELDAELIGPLDARFGDRGLEVLHADALTVALDPLVGNSAPWQVASNLPYSVGTAILRRLMPRHDLFSRLVVMLQLEVARRVVARPGDGNHGLMALERAAWADAHIAFTVHRRAFRPVPKVTSAVLVVTLRPAQADPGDIEVALEIASAALTRPRKMLPNALGSLGGGSEVERAGIDPRIRPGQLALEDWLRLARVLTER